MSGARKSPITPRAISACMIGYASGCAKADLAAAAVRRGGRQQPQPVARALLRDQLRKNIASRSDFSRTCAIGAARASSTPTCKAARLSTGGVPTMAAPMPGAGREIRGEGERFGVAEPAGQRKPQLLPATAAPHTGTPARPARR